MKFSFKQKLYNGYIYLLFAILFISIVLFINYFRDITSIDAPTIIYYSALSLGYAFAYSTIMFLITYAPLSLLFSSNVVPRIAFTIVAIIFQIYIVVDVFVFAIYKFHLDWAGIQFYLNAGKDVFVFDIKLKIGIGLVWFFTSILPYTLVSIYGGRLSKYLTQKKINILTSFFLVLFIASNVTYIFARRNSEMSIIKSTECLPIFPSQFFKDATAGWKSPEAANIDKIMLEIPQGKMNYPLSPIVSNDSVKKPNIVMILIDSWSIRSFDKEVTPNISHFADSAQRFDQHYSGSNATDGSVFSMFYSMPYSYHDAVDRDKTYPVFFEELKKQNYNIGIYSSAYLVLRNTVFGGLKDIDVMTEGGSSFKQDENITKKTIDFIDQQDADKPFFAFTFYDLAHAISIPEEYRHQFTPSWSETNYLALNNDMDPTPFFNLYKNCVYFIDSEIKKILDTLEQKGMLDNTIVIITGDHGQEFNESKQNNWGHSSNFTNWQIQIPFVLYDPQGAKGVEYKHATTHYDLVPTLMHDYLGVKTPIDQYSLGNLMHTDANRYPFWSGGSGEFKVRTGLVFPDFLVTAEHSLGLCFTTDRNLKPLPNSTLELHYDDFEKAWEEKTRFHQKD